MTKTLNCSDILSNASYYMEYYDNCTFNEMGNVTIPDLDENQNLRYRISIAPSTLRGNRTYIRVYTLWLNLIVQVIFLHTFIYYTTQNMRFEAFKIFGIFLIYRRDERSESSHDKSKR